MIHYFILILVYRGRNQPCKNYSIGNAIGPSLIDQDNHHTLIEFEGFTKGKINLSYHLSGNSITDAEKTVDVSDVGWQDRSLLWLLEWSRRLINSPRFHQGGVSK
jgi:hypothetical protein